MDVYAGVSGECHFGDAGEEAAVGSVVVGEQEVFRAEFLCGVPESAEERGVVDVRTVGAGLVVGLGENRSAESVFSLSKVYQPQFGILFVANELWGEGEAYVANWGECGYDEADGGGDASALTILFPDGAHAHGVFAYGDGDSEFGTELESDGFYGSVEVGAVAGDGGGGHPVCGEVDFPDGTDLGGGEVGQRFSDGEACGGSGGMDCDGGAFAHRHGFAGEDVEGGGGDRAIGNRNLPRANHLVARDEAGHGTVTDGNEEGFVSDSGVSENAMDGVLEFEQTFVEGFERAYEGGVATVHARWFSEEHFEGEIDGGVFEMGIGQHEAALFGGFTDDSEGAAFAVTDGGEGGELSGGDGEDVAFLGFVAPDFDGAHAGFVIWHCAEFEGTAASSVVDEFGKCVGDTAGADIVDEGDGVVFAECPAAVDDLLAAALHFGVFALDAGEVEVFVSGAAGHGAGCTAAETDEHGWSAEDDEFIAGMDGAFADVLGFDVAEAAGEHDGFVVAADFRTVGAGDFGFVSPEVAVDGGTSELIIESGTSERAFEHDVEGGDDACGFSGVRFPRLDGAGDAEIGNGESGESGFGFGAASGGTFVADFAA